MLDLACDPDVSADYVEERVEDLTFHVTYEKADTICRVVKELDEEIEALNEQEAAVKKRREAVQEKRKRLRSRLLSSMLEADRTVIDTPLFQVTTQRSPARIRVLDEEMLKAWAEQNAPQCIKQSVDRTAVTKLIKDGAEVPGAELIEQQPQLRINLR